MHEAVQGESRSPSLIPIESPFYLLLVINANFILPRTVSELLQNIAQIFAFDKGYTLVRGKPLNSGPQNLASRN